MFGLKKNNAKNVLIWRFAVVLLILLLAVWLALNTALTLGLKDQLDDASDENFTSLVLDTATRGYVQPVVDMQASRVYFPELRVYVPLSTLSTRIMYKVGVVNDDPSKSSALISTRDVLQFLPHKIGANVCTNPISVDFTDGDSGQSNPVIVSLQDGRKLSIAKNTNNCTNYEDTLKDELTQLFTKAQSY